MKPFKHIFLLFIVFLLMVNVGYAGRYYDCRVARWLTPDPLMQKFPDVSPYNYCHNNPLNKIDIDGNSDISIHVQRYQTTQNSTIGNLMVTNTRTVGALYGKTLELPDNNNAKYTSRIKADSYDAKLDVSKKLGDVVRLEDKNDRTDILIHSGTKPKDTEGCILVGKTATDDKLGESRTMRNELVNYIKDVVSADTKVGETTTITVVVSDPVAPKKEEQPRNGVGMIPQAN